MAEGKEIPGSASESPYKGKHISEVGIRRRGEHGSSRQEQRNPEDNLRREFSFNEESGQGHAESEAGPSRQSDTPLETGAKILGTVLAAKETADLIRGPVDALGRGLRKAVGTERPSDRRRARAGASTASETQGTTDSSTGGGAGGSSGGAERPPTPPGGEENKERPTDPTFSEIIRRLDDPQTTTEVRSYLEALKRRAIDDVESLENGEFLERIRDRLRDELPKTPWNGQNGVVNKLTNLAANADDELERSGGRRSWKGLLPFAMGSEIAKIRLAGIAQKEAGNEDPAWRATHGYNERRVDALQEIVDKNHIYNLLPPNAEALVGSGLEVETPPQPLNELPIAEAMGQLSEQIRLLREHLAANPTAAVGGSPELRQLVSLELQQLELMRKGLRGLIQGVAVRAHVNPEQYDQNLPPWFEELPPAQQSMFRNLLHVNYLAAIKRDTGMTKLDEWSGIESLRFERDAFADMMRELPGFRLAMATMTHDIFDQYKRDDNGEILRDRRGRPIFQDHLVISGRPKYVLDPLGPDDKGYDPNADNMPFTSTPTGGYGIVGSESLLNEYKEKLISKITEYLESTHDESHERYRVTNRDLATMAVSSVDNILFAFGAYDSGDERRAINPGDSNVYSESIRALFMPGLRAEAKWKVLDDVLHTDKEKELDRDQWSPSVRAKWDLDHKKTLPQRIKQIFRRKPDKTEDYGGPIGSWLRENVVANRGNMRKKVINRKIQLLPTRLYYSLLDTTNFAENAPDHREESLSKVLLSADKTVISPRTDLNNVSLFDFVGQENAIQIQDLGSHELIGNYADVRASVIKLYKHITSNKWKEDRADRDGVINALLKMRKKTSKILNRVANNEDFIASCVIMLASPERGLVRGTDQMILEGIDDDLYDGAVNDAISDSRLFEGVKTRGARRRMIERLNAVDLSSLQSTLSAFFPATSRDVSKLNRNSRENIRRRARKNQERSY
jgi:hypothetical protein